MPAEFPLSFNDQIPEESQRRVDDEHDDKRHEKSVNERNNKPGAIHLTILVETDILLNISIHKQRVNRSVAVDRSLWRRIRVPRELPLLHYVGEPFIDVMIEPLIYDRLTESPLLAQFGRRNFLFLRPGVNSLGLDLEVRRHLFKGHDIGLHLVSPECGGLSSDSRRESAAIESVSDIFAVGDVGVIRWDSSCALLPLGEASCSTEYMSAV